MSLVIYGEEFEKSENFMHIMPISKHNLKQPFFSQKVGYILFLYEVSVVSRLFAAVFKKIHINTDLFLRNKF